MAIQSRLDIDVTPFFLSGSTVYKDSETILQDGGRVDPLVTYTLMAQISANKKWVPLTNVAATNGTAIAKGIYVGDDIPAADLADADVTNVPIVVGGALATFADDKLTIENSLTFDTIVAVGTIAEHRVEDDLNRIGLYAESTVDASSYENA
jgi:hypothetical protein